MKDWKENIISQDYSIREALSRLNELAIASGVLFIADSGGRLLGSLTDGDIRRGLLNDKSVTDKVTTVMNDRCKRIFKNDIGNEQITQLRAKGIKFAPVVDEKEVIVLVLDLEAYKEIIPVDAVIMAGGRGERLLPLTKDIPKPLLKVGNKPIIEHNIDRLAQFGIKNIHICINYLGSLIENYLGNGQQKELFIKYIREKEPLGTIGGLSLAEAFEKETILVMNADLLTNMDYGNFYNEFVSSGADMAVATVPHHVDLPYAILELDENRVISLQEKPRYTYFANAGIYLIKTSLLNYIRKNDFCNATDLMEMVIAEKKKLINYPILEYWLDIGRASDFQKAQEDIRHLGF
ncbi:MAG TPA: nucleotidyltransferase family protein [Puia sp.]|nr:nucleotidyltransferase family protein [Puia sp.]